MTGASLTHPLDSSGAEAGAEAGAERNVARSEGGCYKNRVVSATAPPSIFRGGCSGFSS